MKKKRNKEESALDSEVLSEIKRKMKFVKQIWVLYEKNMIWIICVLFTASIIHAIIHFGIYGINIFEFASITDLFINFAIVFIPLIVLLPFSIFLYLFPDGNSKIESIILLIIKVILLIMASIILSRLFNNKIGGGLWLLYFLGTLWIFYYENKQAFAWICILMLFVVSFVAPLERDSTSLVDRMSFKYSNQEYNLTDIGKYYYIGGSSDYFFVFNKSEDKVEILPKNECQDITRPIIHWNDLWKSDEIKDIGPNYRVKRKTEP